MRSCTQLLRAHFVLPLFPERLPAEVLWVSTTADITCLTSLRFELQRTVASYLCSARAFALLRVPLLIMPVWLRQGEENEPGLQSGAAPRGWRGAAPRPASGAGVSQGLETLNLLRDLAALSAQVLADAREDADVFQQGRGGNAQQRQP